jgi:saccharopine dehydrogenase-like NADP-dependent oxidoreductase
MDNIILGYHNKRMEVDFFECLVGGLPVYREWPYEYKAPFSPIDVIAEYTRPARFVRNGKVVTRPALSDAEIIDFPGVGKLEAFNTDGLRSLIHTMQVP